MDRAGSLHDADWSDFIGAQQGSAQQGSGERARMELFGDVRTWIFLVKQEIWMNFSSVLSKPVGHLAGNSMASLAGGGQGPSYNNKAFNGFEGLGAQL